MVPFFMDEQDIPYFMKALQQKSTELFQVTISYEAKFQRQNDIIDQQNQLINDLNTQVQTLSKKTTTTTSRKKKTSTETYEDAGEF